MAGAAFDPAANGLTPYTAPAQGTAQGTSAPAIPPSFAGPGTAASAAMQAAGAQSAGQFANVANEGTQAREQDAVLGNMQNDLTRFASGPGAHNSAQLQKMVQGWTPSFVQNWFTNDPSGVFAQKLAAQESFDKLANQLVSNAAPGSDARQGVIQGATPSSSQTPEGVDFILRQLRGVADYKIARANAAAAPGVDPSGYAAWQAGSAAQLDPQVFQFARMTPDQQSTFYRGIPEAQRPAFQRQFEQTWKNGFYGVNNGMPPHPGP